MKRIIWGMFLMFFVAGFLVQAVQAENLTPQLCKEKVIAAAKLLNEQGDAALAVLKDPGGEFRFADGKGYIWVHNLDGIMLMHPIKEALDGTNVLESKDPNGFYLFVAMNELAEEKGSGWVPYMWPKPGDSEASPKVSYVYLVEKDGKAYVAGAGMYDVTAEQIKAMFPDDPIYED
ncbi:MAG: hypothetical protein DRP78_05945 [Candidatus Omnitrophota bacterium]|nr:MAG: hypothetical protein DRP78_05945 [Candidatus Omnitrophota bacterium]